MLVVDLDNQILQQKSPPPSARLQISARTPLSTIARAARTASQYGITDANVGWLGFALLADQYRRGVLPKHIEAQREQFRLWSSAEALIARQLQTKLKEEFNAVLDPNTLENWSASCAEDSNQAVFAVHSVRAIVNTNRARCRSRPSGFLEPLSCLTLKPIS